MEFAEPWVLGMGQGRAGDSQVSPLGVEDTWSCRDNPAIHQQLFALQGMLRGIPEVWERIRTGGSKPIGFCSFYSLSPLGKVLPKPPQPFC